MKRFFMLLGLALALAGCDSMPSMSERFSPVEPQVRTFDADHSATFRAAVAALKQIDFVQTKAAQTQGRIEGRSGLRGDDAFREVLQYTMEIKLNDVDDTHTEVSVLLREQAEGDLRPGATNQPVRSHGLYDAYFAALAQAIKE